MLRSQRLPPCQRAVEAAIQSATAVSPMSDTCTIGVDVGGTNLRVGSYADDVGLMETIALPTRLAAGRDEVVRDIRDAVLAIADKSRGKGV